MYQNYMNKPTFMTNSSNPSFGASTSTFGQPAANTSMFSSMPPTNIFQTPSTSSFATGPTAQSSFGTNLFGQQPQPSTSGLFGTSNAFGQNKASFGFGANSPAQTGLFGQQPQQQTSASLFQSNSTNLFGSNAFANQTTGTVIKFAPVTGSDTMQKNGVTQSISTKHHCITCMKEYENKSLEELRFEDYSCNRKGPQQQSGFGSTPFGTTTSGATTSLFGQPDNKQTFGQPQTFGQTPAFGQPTPAFGVTNQSSTPTLFGKSTTSTFAFNPPASTSNPFSATQTQKPFSQPLFGTQTPQAQPAFSSTPVFGPTNTQTAGTNLFQKPGQLTTGFNTGQPGFSFNQSNTTQASNLFQVSKPSTGFAIFSQPSSTPAFGPSNVNFVARSVQPSFSRPTQPTFGVDTTGMQQSSLFNTKPPSLFSSTTSGGSLFNSNVFQQTPATFSLNTTQQQVAQFPPESSDESKNISIIATDSFPDGPHVLGLEPLLSDSHTSTTNPKDLKRLLDYTKKRDETLGTQAKIKVHMPKPKRGNNYSKEFFETNQSLKGSHKCLVIRKFNEPSASSSTIYNKYKNELLEEAERCLKKTVIQPDTTTDNNPISPRSIFSEHNDLGETASDYKARMSKLKLNFESSITDDTEEGRFIGDTSPRFSSSSSKTSLVSSKSTNSPRFSGTIRYEDDDELGDVVEPIVTTPTSSGDNQEHVENAAGVVLTKPEYYMYPAQKDLHQYIDDNGECVVQGLTIGRRGYGNVYFPDPVEISNMNFDEIVHFRHREVIIYPDDAKKPPVGEGLNRRAQVTLDKIYPREKGTANYITDVNEITQTNFVDNLMHVTQKHRCKFVDYRPKTGSWVFKVKHFSKYAFTDSDEEECEVIPDKTVLQKQQDVLKKIDEMEGFGLGGLDPRIKSSSLFKEIDTVVEDVSIDEHMLTDEIYQTDTAIQTLKSSLFTNLDVTPQTKETETVIKPRQALPSEVIATPKLYKLPNISLLINPEKATTNQRCYTELGIFRCNTYKVGWSKGFNFFVSDPVVDGEVMYSLTHCNMNAEGTDDYNSMMPDLTNMLKITLEESDFTFDKNKIPTLHIRKDVSYLQKQTKFFNDHVKSHSLTGRDLYLCSVWNLCLALWGPSDNSSFSRRQNLSNWLKKFACDLSNEWCWNEDISLEESKAFKSIFKQLSFYKIEESCELASRNKLDRLSLLISQMSANERFKCWMQKYVESFEWREKNTITDDFKKLYLLLAGMPIHQNINICEDLDWLRCFGLHLWYVAPAASPIHVAFNLYKDAFEEHQYATEPTPPYYDLEPPIKEYDILYHILALYVDSTYQLCKLLHPETHTENAMDYRLSWFILQLFLSLEVGLVRDSEKEHLHTTFSTQLENMGHWKWSIFPLLFLENNILKKTLIMRILDRNLATFLETSEMENELVRIFKIPTSWIHEVKATKAKVSGKYYDSFQHYINMGDYFQANEDLVNNILPELFINEQYDYLMNFIHKMEPFSNSLVNWDTQVGLVKEFINLQEVLNMSTDKKMISTTGKLSSLLRRINCFPVKNDQQKLCVAELSRKCAFVFKHIHKNLSNSEFQAKYVDVLANLVMPPDIKHYEIFYLISKFVQHSG